MPVVASTAVMTTATTVRARSVRNISTIQTY
jgi:hypothetical protein